MRNITILIILMLLFSPQLVDAADTGQGDSPAKKILLQSDLQEIFTSIIKENIPARIEEFRVGDFSSQPESVSVPEGKLSYRLIHPILCATPGKKFVSAVLVVNGREYDSIKMYGNVQFWGTVILASHSISRRTILSAADIKTDFRDISMLGDNQLDLPGKVIGKQLAKSLRADDIIFTHLLKNPPVVSRGDLVTIIAKSGGLQVSAPGEVKNAGAVGETVRVKNLASRRILQAKVVGEGLVEIEL